MFASLIASLVNRGGEATAPESRSGHAAVLWNDIMYIWGGYNRDTNLDYHETKIVWKYHVNHHKWSKASAISNFPSPRVASCFTLFRGQLFIFGGCGRLGDLNDVHLLQLNSSLKSDVVRWRELRPQGMKPSKRNKAACCTYENKVIIFAGYGPPPSEDNISNGKFHYDEDSVFYHRGWNNHLFAYDFSTNEWISLPNSGDVPSTRAAHSMAAAGNKAFIFGGRHCQERLNDMYSLCLDTYQWTSVAQSTSVPIGRSWHTFTPIGENQFFLFGGFDTEQNVLGDGWIYNAEENWWLKVKTTEYCRLWHTSCPGAYPAQVLVFAGCENNIFDQPKHTSSLLCFNVQPKSLQRCCVETVARNLKMFYDIEKRLPPSLLAIVRRICDQGG